MTPRTGRPKTENPRTEKVSITLTKEDVETLKEAREKDKNPERSFLTWVGRKVSEMAQKLRKKQK